MKVMSIFGTRPEMIKMWATLKKLDELNFEHIMVHTGQNFTPELRDFFFKDLKLRKPDYELDIDTSGYGPEVADVGRGVVVAARGEGDGRGERGEDEQHEGAESVDHRAAE